MRRTAGSFRYGLLGYIGPDLGLGLEGEDGGGGVEDDDEEADAVDADNTDSCSASFLGSG